MCSPAYAFTSLHYLKHQGISSPPISSSLLFSLLYFPFISADLLSLYFLLASSFLSPILYILFPPDLSSSFPSTLLASLLILLYLPCLLPTILPCPFSSSPPAVAPPLTTSLYPLMIAEHISFDTKTKGWVHMWFLCKSCVIWNINAGIIWLPGWGGGGGGIIITSDCRFLP